MASILDIILSLLGGWPGVLCGAAFLGVVGYKLLGIAGGIIGTLVGGWLGLVVEQRMMSGEGRTSRSGWQFVIGSLLIIAAIAIATR